MTHASTYGPALLLQAADGVRVVFTHLREPWLRGESRIIAWDGAYTTASYRARVKRDSDGRYWVQGKVEEVT